MKTDLYNGETKYNVGEESERNGHLYGAIIASIRDYQKAMKERKYAMHHLAYAGHYIGDLSMPFHNMDFNQFNKANHTYNDGIVENEVKSNID